MFAKIGARATELELELWSGGAPGADTMAEDGHPGAKAIFLPWRGFNGNPSPLFPPSDEAYRIAAKFHRSWASLSSAEMDPHPREDLAVLAVLAHLRNAAALASSTSRLESLIPRPLTRDSVVSDVDVHAWINWSLAGLPVFAGGLPRIRSASVAAQVAVFGTAMDRAVGNITNAASSVGVSRRRLRETLTAADLMPWPTREPR